ncbi:MAG: lycopene beta-cyclase CrtY [Myxococcales bacterium]|nr:lycopene beta-cyclase CrtY [Myxococcales bacterium]MCB9581936.1 lycopene beta-cyclase CrtY [Polyangiaceae bacterium]
MTELDAILVGGGLANGLIALALATSRPGSRILIVEREAEVGGNHVWCFHADDADDAPWVEPLVVRRWPGYSVKFPELARTVSSPYAAVTSDRFREVLKSTPGITLLTGVEACAVSANTVTIKTAGALRAKQVFDGRGPNQLPCETGTHFQKFLGLELRLSRPSPISEPLLMDARVPQTDGFRFIYALPFDEDRVLVEDTYFSPTANLDAPRLREEIIGWAHRQGFDIQSVEREERGVLPLPTRMSTPDPSDGALRTGYGGGWFHPTTGYSFPVAVRFAKVVAENGPEELRPALARLAAQHGRQLRYATFLNRLLFGAFSPEDQRNVLERFYRLPEASIRRFYALNTTTSDRARILCGRPPRGFSLRVAFTRGAVAS